MMLFDKCGCIISVFWLENHDHGVRARISEVDVPFVLDLITGKALSFELSSNLKLQSRQLPLVRDLGRFT